MIKAKPKLLIFASGTKEGGGSGFKNLMLASRLGILEAEIVAVVSNHQEGGVRRLADELGVAFEYFPKPWTAEEYQRIVAKYQADFVTLSGWLKLVPVDGLDPRTTINIHPGPLPQFGGTGMYGHHVHEAVIAAFHRGEITQTEVCMHFVTPEYDEGPIIARVKVKIEKDDTPESLAARVNQVEHQYQPIVTSLVVTDEISWDGRNPASLRGSFLLG